MNADGTDDTDESQIGLIVKMTNDDGVDYKLK